MKASVKIRFVNEVLVTFEMEVPRDFSQEDLIEHAMVSFYETFDIDLTETLHASEVTIELPSLEKVYTFESSSLK